MAKPEFRDLTVEEIKSWVEGGAKFERRDLGCDIYDEEQINDTTE
jgi:hypothetical protein